METKEKIVANWLPRYTRVSLKHFGSYILLTNFNRYLQLFPHSHRGPVHSRNKPMTSAPPTSTTRRVSSPTTFSTTTRRIWENDGEFKKSLKKTRATAIERETATIFTAAFANEIPAGALLLVSDQPMTPEGVKTIESDRKIDEQHVSAHIRIGLDSLKQLINKGLTVKHLKF